MTNSIYERTAHSVGKNPTSVNVAELIVEIRQRLKAVEGWPNNLAAADLYLNERIAMLWMINYSPAEIARMIGNTTEKVMQTALRGFFFTQQQHLITLILEEYTNEH